MACVLLRHTVRNAGDAIFDQHGPEIDQQAKSFIGKLEIGLQLLFEHLGDFLDRLKLNNDFVLDHQIGAISDINYHALVLQGNRFFGFYFQAAFA